MQLSTISVRHGPVCLLCRLLFIYFALVVGPLSFGQTFTSSITGAVNDATGALVAGANVQLKNMATNDVRNATTQDDGTYQFNNLRPGTYQITVTAPGFKTFVQQNLVLQGQ